MKRKSKVKTLAINQATRLFFEDIERIYSLISEVTDKVTIETDDYEFESLQDILGSKLDVLNSLKLVGYKDRWPYIFFFVYPNAIHIRLEKDESASLGTAEKIKEFVNTRKRPYWPPLVPFSFAPFVSMALAIAYRYITKTQDFIYYTLFWVTIILNIPVWYFNLSTRNQIILNHSKNTSSFWKRNSDTIVVAVLTSIITLVIAYVFGKITAQVP